MEANKKALESLEVNGDQVIVDYMGKKPIHSTLVVKVSYSNAKDTHEELIQ